MYPSVITSFNYPTPTDRLNSPSHSALHNTTSSAVGQVQAFVGTLSSVPGTLMYDVRSANSDGGGHVQTASKGGTGQTTFTKGDLLVASSSSVLTKLAVGVDNQVLAVNSSVATGVQWVQAASSNKIAVSPHIASVATVNLTSLMSVVVPGSTLGTSNAIKTTLFIDSLTTREGASSVAFYATYGSNTIASVVLTTTDDPAQIVRGTLDFYLFANSSVTSQSGRVILDLKRNLPATITGTTTVASYVGTRVFTRGTSSIQSTADQVVGVSFKFSDVNVGTMITTSGYIVEKVT